MANKEKKELNYFLNVLAKSYLIVLIGVILSKILTYLYRILIARSYGPEVYGLFSLSIMIAGLFATIFSLGLDRGIIRYLSFYKGKNDKKTASYLFLISLKILFWLGLFAFTLLFLLSDFIAVTIFKNESLSIFLKIFSLSVFFEIVSRVFLTSLLANQRAGWYSFIANIFGNTLRLGVFILLMFTGFDSTAVPISHILGGLSMLILSFIVVRITEPFLFKDSEKNKPALKSLFSYSWPLIFFGFILSIFYWTDSFLIGYFLDVEAVGFYNAAIPIAMLLTLSKEIFSYLFLPIVTEEYSKNNLNEVRQLSKQVTKWIYLLSLPLFILFLIFPGVFIKLLFGPDYLVAENALRILSVGAFFMAILDINKELLSMKGKSKLILFCTIVAASLNIILNLYFIPTLGINGAAIATSISLVFLNILFFYFSNRELSIIPFRRKMIHITFYSILLTSGLIILRNYYYPSSIFHLALVGLTFILLYFLAIFFGGCLDENDRFVINSIKKKLSRF